MRLPPAWAMMPVAFRSSRLFSGAGGKDAPAAIFLDERLVIEFRHEAQERQGEAVLAARLAVAAAAVAAELGEDRHDVVGEVDRQVCSIDVVLTRIVTDLIADSGR